jgi:RimJ/RimL family protein N-acetyltransferase
MSKHTEAPTVESTRLSMRSLTNDDETFYCSLYTDTDVMKFVGAPLSRDLAVSGFRKSLERMNGSDFERRVVVLVERATNQPIGISSVRIVNDKKGRAEVGTLLKPAAHEQGFAQECSIALITQAFTRHQIKELVAYSATGNSVIERLLTELGFKRGESLPASSARPARVAWTLSRHAWSKRTAGDNCN